MKVLFAAGVHFYGVRDERGEHLRAVVWRARRDNRNLAARHGQLHQAFDVIGLDADTGRQFFQGIRRDHWVNP
jgi:hypothetical protein